MKKLLLINPENVSEEEAATYTVREAARGVVVDRDGLIAMLFVSKEGYFKLPGGGSRGRKMRSWHSGASAWRRSAVTSRSLPNSAS